jgi:transcriptional regulator
MYLPAHFDDKHLTFARELMRAHPFASLISNDDQGLPFVTHLPLHLDEDHGQPWRLFGHCARPNPHWRYLEARPTAVVTFLGPQGYLSPKVYPDAARVPTWNYLAVHATVSARLIHDPEEKDRTLKLLIGDHEPAYAQQWQALPADFTGKMLNGIVAFELTLSNVQCKLKLNQHRPEAFEAMVAACASGDEQSQALAQWMRRLRASKEK